MVLQLFTVYLPALNVFFTLRYALRVVSLSNDALSDFMQRTTDYGELTLPYWWLL